MKKNIKLTVTTIFFLLLTITFSPAFAVNGDPPPPPGEHGQTGNQPPGGGAAIGGGVLMLIVLGAGYGAKKWYQYHKKSISE